MSNIVKKVFDNNAIRVVNKEGDAWFVAVDICNALKISNPSKALKVLEENERSNFKLGRQGSVNIISESGMYTLVLRCRDAIKPDTPANRFKKWVTSEVLPTIRKTGNYSLTINDQQQFEIKEAVIALNHATNEPYQSIYSRLYREFKIPKYQQLLVKDFNKAIDFLKVEQLRIKTKDEVNMPFFLNEVADYMVRVRSGKICRYKLAYISKNTDYGTEYGTLLTR